MAKLHKKVHDNEDKCDKLHKEMNMRVGPPTDLDPMQKQLNRIENTVNHEVRCRNRRNWKCNK